MTVPNVELVLTPSGHLSSIMLDGEAIHGVRSVSVTASVGVMPVVTLELFAARVDVNAIEADVNVVVVEPEPFVPLVDIEDAVA